MARSIFIGSAVLCLLCIGLSQVPDPRFLGIDDEPERILFYGGSGLLAGLSGLVAFGSGVYLGATRVAGLSEDQRRLVLAIMWIVLISVLVAFVLRLLSV
jgi:hypothetical protein